MKKTIQVIFLTLLLLGILVLAGSAGNSPGNNLLREIFAGELLPSVYLPVILRPVMTPTIPPEPSAYFSVGNGFTDVIPRQIVRTATDHLYLFAPHPFSKVIKVYWATGLPSGSAHFSVAAQIIAASEPISLEAIYDGGNIVHVLINTLSGEIKNYPFDTSLNQFRSPINLATDGGTLTGEYIGTSGLSGMIDLSGILHVVYWTQTNHIIHRAYTYDIASNRLTPVGGSTQVDSGGKANHPVLAVSPLDNSLTIAWVSEIQYPMKILTRTRTSTGVWGTIQTASAAPVWTSTNAGINIDQGPSLLIGSDGKKHLAYIQNYNGPVDYGRIHYVVGDQSGWIDQALNAYSHDPALAVNAQGELYLIGHGHPLSPACKSMDDMCTIKKNSDGSWGIPQLFAAHPATASFDSSASVKWSVVGFNRPDLIEFAFFATPYTSPTLYYGRFSTR